MHDALLDFAAIECLLFLEHQGVALIWDATDVQSMPERL
jgi:hypothetical protein